MMPSIVVMPNSARKPMAPGTEKFSPDRSSAVAPPMQDSGSSRKIRMVSRTLLNWT